MSITGGLKIFLYLTMVICFLGAGMCEVFEGHYRMGAVSGLLGVVQALIFLVGRN